MRFSLEDCTIYASSEPCPMCLAAIYRARIPSVFYGNTRADAATIGFDDDFIYREMPLPAGERAIEVRQLMREEAQAAFREWQLKPDKQPY
jgi:guanine deaminase